MSALSFVRNDIMNLMDRFRSFGRFLVGLAVIIAAVYLFPYPWKIGSVTVTGEAKMESAPQVASFNATVMVSDDNKDTAVSTVNKKMTDLISALKTFGVAEADIQTQSVTTYENQGTQILTYPPRQVDQKKWTASNSIEIRLRDTSKASTLADILNNSGATGVSGPNFAVDNTKTYDAELLAKAVADAKSKAERIALAGGRRLGKMKSVSESGVSQPVPYALEARSRDTGAPIEPGTQTLSRTVIVTFEIY